MELFPPALLENGYHPLNDDANSKVYTTLENWVSVSDLFEKKLAEAREEIAEDLHDEIVESIMKKNGYVYNAKKGQWLPPAEQEKSQENKGVFQKLKGVFGH